MGVMDDQTTWRMVFSENAALMNVTTFPNPNTEHTVIQSNPALLLVTSTPDAGTAQEVIQDDDTKLLCTTTPHAELAQRVHQAIGVNGIWPAPDATRIHKTGIADGIQKVTIYTVPADTILYISSSYLASWENADAESMIRLQVENQASTVKYFLTNHYYAKAGQLSSGERNVPALEAIATDKVVLQSYHANLYGRGKFDGWLEDV